MTTNVSAFQPNAFQTSSLAAFQGFQVAGVLGFPTSHLDPTSMQILGTSDTETLLWDFSSTEEFYVLTKPPEATKTTLFLVTPVFARNWIAHTATTVIYNPFNYNSTNLSNL